MCGFNNKRDGDWSDSGVVTNTDRTQQTIELINRIEILEKKLEIATRYLGLYADEDNSDRHNYRWAKLAFVEMERVEE